MQVTSPQLIILEKVDSTNNYAMAMVHNKAINSGDAVFAKEQTSGKGRRSKVWESEKEKNIIISLVAQMQWLPVREQFKLSMAVALSCMEFLSGYINENVKIKWPNDIFINDSKAGGILIENVIQGNLWQWAIIGIGLNINQVHFNDDKLNAISLRQVTSENYDVMMLAGELHKIVLKKLQALKKGDENDLLKSYNANLFALNKKVSLKKGNATFETIIKGVTESGNLITKDVIERSFGFDEIEWVGLQRK